MHSYQDERILAGLLFRKEDSVRSEAERRALHTHMQKEDHVARGVFLRRNKVDSYCLES